jgi:hypothetical protein
MLPNSDKATGSNDAIYTEEGKYAPAPYSMLAREKLERTLEHLARVLRESPDDTDYIAFVMGNTSEYYLPMIKKIELVNNVQVITNEYMTGYSTVDRAAWATYSAAHGMAGVQPPVTSNANSAFTTGDLWNTATGRLWYEFITDGLAGLHASFVRAVKAGGGKPCAFFADAGGAQSAWFGTAHLNRIFAGSSVVYSSEGGNVPDLWKKLMAADLIMGTFPNAEAGIEVDQEDIALNQSDTSYGAPINSDLLFETFTAHFERGGKIGHLAMAFDPHSNIPQMAPALYRLQNEFIKQGSQVASLPVGETIYYTVNSFSGDQGYNQLWRNAGGGKNKQVKIVLS